MVGDGEAVLFLVLSLQLLRFLLSPGAAKKKVKWINCQWNCKIRIPFGLPTESEVFFPLG